ncbi:MAG: hypothetical protein ABEN55_01485, partial [Bradymonadaceae bacterium]
QSPDPCARRAGREIEDLLKEVQTITLSGIHVLDYRGTIVTTTQNIDRKSFRDRLEIDRALSGEIVTAVRHREQALETWSLESIKRRTQVRVYVALPIAH